MNLFKKYGTMNHKVHIFGAGKRGKQVYDVLNAYGFEILGFIDNSAEKQGSTFAGKQVYGFEEALLHMKSDGIIVVVSPKNCKDICFQ